MFDADAFWSLAQIARHLALKAVPSFAVALVGGASSQKAQHSLLPKLLMAWCSKRGSSRPSVAGSRKITSVAYSLSHALQ